MKVRHMTHDSGAQSGCNCVPCQAGLLAPLCPHHPPEVPRVSPHHGREPQPHRDRRRKLSDVARNENNLRLCRRLFVNIWRFHLSDNLRSDRLADDQLYSEMPHAINYKLLFIRVQ